MKRGTDHTWEIRKYKGDIMLYAHCSCGYEYGASTNKLTPDGKRLFEQEIYGLYRYCPWCGARKKWMTEVIQQSKTRWE